jgi:hypothetical protein
MFLDVFEGNVRLFLSADSFVGTHNLVAPSFGSCGLIQQYVRKEVHIHPLGRLTAVPSDAAVSSSEAMAVEGSLIPAALPSLPSAGELAQPIPAQTYVWCSKDSYLEKELWSFDEFVKNNAHKWIGREAESSKEYEEVDEAKESLNGEIMPDEAQT